MAAERGNSDDSLIVSSLDPKIVTRGEFLFGYSGNTGVGQAVQYGFTIPPLKNKKNVSEHMIGVVVPAMRQFFKAKDITWSGDPKDDDGCSLLFGVAGRIYECDTADFQMVEYKELAIGSGGSYALGSLFSTRHIKDPKIRLRYAVESAIEFSPSCRGPVDYFHEPVAVEKPGRAKAKVKYKAKVKAKTRTSPQK